MVKYLEVYSTMAIPAGTAADITDSLQSFLPL